MGKLWTLPEALDRDEAILAEEGRIAFLIEKGEIRIGDRTAEYLTRRGRIIGELEKLVQEYGPNIPSSSGTLPAS